MKWLINIISFILLADLASAVCIYGTGIYGTEIYGGDCNLTSPNPLLPGGLTPSSATILDKSESAVNNTCRITQQLYDGKCWNCTPSNGWLEFRNESRELLCHECNEGYVLSSNNCTEGKKINIGKRVIIGASYSDIAVILILSGFSIYYFRKWKKKRAKIKEDKIKEDEGDDEEINDEGL